MPAYDTQGATTAVKAASQAEAPPAKGGEQKKMSNETANLRQADYAVPAQAAQWQKRSLIVGVVGVVVCIVER